MWTIKPDYNKEQKCFYCGKNKAAEGKEVSRDLFKIVGKGFPLAVKYVKIDVNIPRCEECKKRHDTAGKPTCFVFLLGIFVAICCVVYFILTRSQTENIPLESIDSSESTNWFGFICVGLTILLVWFVISYFIGSIIRLAINAFMKGTKDEMDDDNYSPIKKLLDFGFMKQKPDAAAHYGISTDFNMQALQNTFNSIIKEDNCIIMSKK